MSQLPNQRCACGSGKKFKKCCQNSGMRNLTDEEWAERRRWRRAQHATLADLSSDMGAMVATLMMGPGFMRMQEDMEARRELAELQATVDSLKNGATLDLDNLPPGLTLVRG